MWTGGYPPKRVTSPTWGPPPPWKQALRDLSEISSGGGEVQNRGRSQFFEPFNKEGYEKNNRKRGRVTKNSHHDREHTKIVTCDYFLTCSSTSIKRPQPPFGHPKESFLSVVTSIKQLCIKRLIHLFWICFKNTMKESTVQERRWRVWPYGLCIMALEWLRCNDSHNYQAAVSLHFVLFCFLFACCFVTCPWLEHHLKGFPTETTFRSITFFAKIVWFCWVCLCFV